MASQETSSVEPNTVVTVYQKGYSLNDRLLRPALVVISKPAAQNVPNIDERA
jgi:molecular chaperone GrpE